MSGSFFFTLLYGTDLLLSFLRQHDGLHLRTLFACNQWSDTSTRKGAAETRVEFVCISIRSVAVLGPAPTPQKSAGDLLQISVTGGAKQIKFSKTL